MKYKNIIFDFDGTLADTADLTVATMQRTIEALSLPNASEEVCRSMIGYRLEEIPSILWPEFPDLSEQFASTFREIFKTIKDLYSVQLYSHVLDALIDLKCTGIGMAVASSRSRVSLQEYLTKLHIDGYFQMVVSGGDVKNGKPAPDPVNLILATQGWNKEETLVVGDMNVDILMGIAAGTATCGVTNGNGSIDELKEAGADYIISDFSELIRLCIPVIEE